MKLGFVLFLGFLTATAFPQNKPDQSPELPKGSVLRVVLSEQIDVANSKVGDIIRTRVVGLVGVHGIKRPRNPLTLLGHITEVQARTGDEEESRLGLTFDKILISSVTGEPRSLMVTGVIKRVVTVETSFANNIISRPASGDDPVARAAGPMVDSNGRPVAPERAPLEVPSPIGVSRTFDKPVKHIHLYPGNSANVTVIASKKGNIVLTSEAVMIVEVTGSGS